MDHQREGEHPSLSTLCMLAAPSQPISSRGRWQGSLEEALQRDQESLGAFEALGIALAKK